MRAGWIVCGVVLVLAGLRGSVGQYGGTLQGTGTQHPAIGQGDPKDVDPNVLKVREEMVKRQNDDRHKKMVEDTTRLLKLAGELKEAVDKSTKDELSLEVVRKAAEVEKLARDVKERMKG